MSHSCVSCRVVALHSPNASMVLGIGSLFVVTVTVNHNETGLVLVAGIVNGVNVSGSWTAVSNGYQLAYIVTEGDNPVAHQAPQTVVQVTDPRYPGAVSDVVDSLRGTWYRDSFVGFVVDAQRPVVTIGGLRNGSVAIHGMCLFELLCRKLTRNVSAVLTQILISLGSVPSSS